MQEMLKAYLLTQYTYTETIIIKHYDLLGSGCIVKFYTDESETYEETATIDCWDMIAFIYENLSDH